MSIDKVFRSFPAPKKYVLYDLAAQFYIDRLITKHIPPKAEVNDEFIQAFRNEVKRQNEASDRGNEKIRKELKQFKADVLAGKVKFEDQAVAGEGVESKPGQVVWGVFERGSMDDPKVQAAAFALKAGEISDPVEDDDGIHLIKVYAIAAPEKNESGRVIQDEVRTLGHVYREKVPRMIEDEDAIMRKELRQQMQIQAINDFIQVSTTNGTARIEYPHGKGVIK